MSIDETIITNIKGLKDEGEKIPHLTFITGSRLGQIHPLEKPEIIVGRAPDCDLVVEDTAISRKHFKVILKADKLKIEDLGSTNGTYVNGERVKKAELVDGDKIQISQNTLLEVTYLDQSRSLSEKQRYDMGVKDPVTNVYNKRFLIDRLNEEFAFAKRRGRPLSLILFDLDFFKTVNDTYGHLAGDLVLQKVAAVIAETIRTDDILPRYGGEEFVIIMRDAAIDGALLLAERMRKLVEALKINYEKSTIKITISLGVSTLMDYHKQWEHLLAEADKYMYISKSKGRNRATGPD